MQPTQIVFRYTRKDRRSGMRWKNFFGINFGHTFYLVFNSEISVSFRSLISTSIEKVKITILVGNCVRNIFCFNSFSLTRIVNEEKLKNQKFSQKICQNLLLFVEKIGIKWFMIFEKNISDKSYLFFNSAQLWSHAKFA